MSFQVRSIPVTAHTVMSLVRVSHGIFEATLATGVTWAIDRKWLMTMDQGPAKLITLELRECRADANRMDERDDSPPKCDSEPDPEDEFAYGDPYEGLEWDNDDMYVDLCREMNVPRRPHAAADCPPTPDEDPKRDDYSHVDLLAQINARC